MLKQLIATFKEIFASDRLKNRMSNYQIQRAKKRHERRHPKTKQQSASVESESSNKQSTPSQED